MRVFAEIYILHIIRSTVLVKRLCAVSVRINVLVKLFLFYLYSYTTRQHYYNDHCKIDCSIGRNAAIVSRIRLRCHRNEKHRP